MYCGWQTRAARIRWGAVVCLLVAFAALGIMYAIVSKDCEVCDEIAHTKDPETGETWASLELCYQYKGAGDLSSAQPPSLNLGPAEARHLSQCVNALVALHTTGLNRHGWAYLGLARWMFGFEQTDAPAPPIVIMSAEASFTCRGPRCASGSTRIRPCRSNSAGACMSYGSCCKQINVKLLLDIAGLFHPLGVLE